MASALNSLSALEVALTMALSASGDIALQGSESTIDRRIDDLQILLCAQT
jgi:hypothetical protein